MRSGFFHSLRTESGYLGLLTALAFLLHGILAPLPQAKAAQIGFLCAQMQDADAPPAEICKFSCAVMCGAALFVPARDTPTIAVVRRIGQADPLKPAVAATPWRTRGEPIRGPPSQDV